MESLNVFELIGMSMTYIFVLLILISTTYILIKDKSYFLLALLWLQIIAITFMTIGFFKN